MNKRIPALLLIFSLVAGWQPGFAQRDDGDAPEGSVNIEIILDVSGSMAQIVDNDETRMDAAKRVLTDVVGGFPDREGVNVGLRIYGHKGDNTDAGKDESCQSSELVVPVEGVDTQGLLDEIESLQPTGWTPLALSLEQSADDFPQASDEASNYVILVTDGLETCGGEPCMTSAELHASDAKATVSVIGLALIPAEQETIACIAEEGGGEVYGAADASELSNALFTALSTPVPDIEKPTPDSNEDGTLEISGTGSAVTDDFSLETGRYEVTLDLATGCCISVFLYAPSGGEALLFNQIFPGDGGTATVIHEVTEPGMYFIGSENTVGDADWNVTFKKR